MPCNQLCTVLSSMCAVEYTTYEALQKEKGDIHL